MHYQEELLMDKPRSYDLDSIRKSSGLTPNDEDQLIKWYASLAQEARLLLMDKAYERFRNHPNRSDWKGKFAELQYASFFAELADYRSQKEATRRKAKYDTSEPKGSTVDEIIAGSIKVGQRPNKKRRIIAIRSRAAITELREKNKSWRFIAEYLTKKHRVKFSHTYVARIWKEIQNK